jgi:hypothetical protein
VASWTADGDFNWARRFGGAGEDRTQAVDVDPAGDILIGGYFSGSADFETGTGAVTLTSTGGKDAVLAKIKDPVDTVRVVNSLLDQSTVCISFDTVAAYEYHLEARSPAGGSWTEVDHVVGTGATVLRKYPLESGLGQFFRVRFGP